MGGGARVACQWTVVCGVQDLPSVGSYLGPAPSTVRSAAGLGFRQP